MVKINEIMTHIGKLFDHFAEDGNMFDEYCDHVLAQDLDKALLCFRDLVRQTEFVKKTRKKICQSAPNGKI